MKELLKLLSIALAISTSATYAVISGGHKDAKADAASTEDKTADADVKSKIIDFLGIKESFIVKFTDYI